MSTDTNNRIRYLNLLSDVEEDVVILDVALEENRGCGIDNWTHLEVIRERTKNATPYGLIAGTALRNAMLASKNK